MGVLPPGVNRAAAETTAIDNLRRAAPLAQEADVLLLVENINTVDMPGYFADTPERAQQGLMFVSDLPETMGMVFPLPAARVETMWMQNTYIELDMLFIRADGRVAKIIERAHPMSEALLSSDTPVSAVLELRGGEVQKLGLKTGDTVAWKRPAP